MIHVWLTLAYETEHHELLDGCAFLPLAVTEALLFIPDSAENVHVRCCAYLL